MQTFRVLLLATSAVRVQNDALRVSSECVNESRF